MNILEKVTRAMDDKAFDHFDIPVVVALVITAFLKAAAEAGWHMRPDEATEEMIDGVTEPGGIEEYYRAMQAAAPEFEWKSGS